LHTEAGEVVAAGAGGHHLDRAAGQVEGGRPQRALARPVGQLLDGGDQDAARQLLQAASAAHAQSHSNPPRFQSYTDAMTSIPRKMPISAMPKTRSCRKTTAQG